MTDIGKILYNEFAGPRKGVNLYTENEIILVKIRKVLKLYVREPHLGFMIRKLRQALYRRGSLTLTGGVAVNHLRPIWTHNLYLHRTIPDLENILTFEIKEMERQIYSASAEILQIDSFNVANNLDVILTNYNPIAFVEDKVGDILVYLVNLRDTINFRDYQRFGRLAEERRSRGKKIKIFLDVDTPSGSEFLSKLKNNGINFSTLGLESVEGECLGTRADSASSNELHVLVTVRYNKFDLVDNSNYQIFDTIPHGDIIFLRKEFLKENVIEAYKKAVEEVKFDFSRLDAESLYKMWNPEEAMELIRSLENDFNPRSV